MKRQYLKKNFKFWTVKKLDKHSLNIWYLIYILMSLVLLWALINKAVNSASLISPVALYIPKPVYASELKKEDTRAWKLYQRIRWIESNNGTKGLAVTCKNKGGFNEVGYLPYKGFCFKSEWEQELTTMQYIENKLNNGWTENNILCFWNTGKRLSSCAYSNGDLKNAN